MQALFWFAQHIYEKGEGSGSVPLTNGTGSGRTKTCRRFCGSGSSRLDRRTAYLAAKAGSVGEPVGEVQHVQLLVCGNVVQLRVVLKKWDWTFSLIDLSPWCCRIQIHWTRTLGFTVFCRSKTGQNFLGALLTKVICTFFWHRYEKKDILIPHSTYSMTKIFHLIVGSMCTFLELAQYFRKRFLNKKVLYFQSPLFYARHIGVKITGPWCEVSDFRHFTDIGITKDSLHGLNSQHPE